jgi:alginate O-acetyltransferase complex protein AlgI
LFAGILGNILILIFMKYLSFILENINALAEHVGAHPITLLWTPVSVGVSFFVFQAVGYLVEVYLEVQVPERHLGQFALSLAFFPKLIQGLIEHCGNLVRQFRNPRPVDYNLVRSGPLLLGVGVFKKLVIADRFGLLVDNVYGNFRSPDIEA